MVAQPQARSLQVFEQIKMMIIAGELRPGDELPERDLAERLGVSRVPVREALPMLEAVGLVQLSPRRSARVTRITERDMTELFQVRASLEPLAARLAADNVSAGADPTHLQTELEGASTALRTGDDQSFHEHSAQLHLEIERLAASRLLDTVMTSLRERSSRLDVINIGIHAEPRHREHEMLVAAISGGDARLAASVAYSHVEFGRQRTSISVLDQYGLPPEETQENG